VLITFFVKGVVLWEHLIDAEKIYQFPVEIEVSLLTPDVISSHSIHLLSAALAYLQAT